MPQFLARKTNINMFVDNGQVRIQDPLSQQIGSDKHTVIFHIVTEFPFQPLRRIQMPVHTIVPFVEIGSISPNIAAEHMDRMIVRQVQGTNNAGTCFGRAA
jgi:hypothetical protein